MADFTYDDAAHLLRRMGFGGNPAQISALQGMGMQSAVDSLLNFNLVDNSVLDNILASSFDFSNPTDFTKFNSGELQRWWFTRIVYTARPFEEKLTLFWHNHFATAVSKVPELFMYIQNRMLRANGLGRFDDLLLKVAQDPAMLLWLDGITSSKGTPNENFARELQELFTLGIHDVVTNEQNYTEDDVKQIARAFTGWRFYQPDQSQPFNFTFVVDNGQHDFDSKTIYGVTANYGGEDVIPIIAARRSAARFLVKKIFEYFVYPVDASGADQPTIEKYADVYFNNNHSLAKLLRAVFTSDEFFSDRARFALVKSPPELIVGAIRMLGGKYNPGTSGSQGDANILAAFSVLLGQELFNPPDVSGWAGGLSWINTSTLLNRYTYGDFLTSNRQPDITVPGMWIPASALKKYTRRNTGKTIQKFLSLAGPLVIDDTAAGNLGNYLQTGPDGGAVPFKGDDASIDRKVRGLVHQIMCLPEFQLN